MRMILAGYKKRVKIYEKIMPSIEEAYNET